MLCLVTDQDKDGLDDTLQAEVEDLVKAAEEAEKAAEDALVEANKDGLITPEENQNLTDLNNAVTEAKDKAQAKVDELPESTGKDSFQDRLDVIDGIVVPGITDQDKDGLDDTLQAEVEDLVKAAEEAEKAAEDALVEANKDGLITPEENQNLTDLNNAVTEAKDKAQAKVDELPESTGKDSFQDRLDVIDGIVVPGITDQDKDGLDDTLQAEVEDLVKAAEEAEKAAEDALVEANKDGLITPEENQNLTDLNNAVTEAKDKAQAKVDELPESTGKDSFQDRLDVIDGIVVPGITDQDKDGLDDTLQAEVEDLVKAAEEAEKAAEDALVEANKDGLITPEENQNLTDLNNAVTEAKDKAQAKVDELPESTGKDSFQDRLDVIDGIVVPGITDQDKDGLDDTLQAEVEDLVKAAEEAEKAAEDALVEANKDGLITPEENQNLTDLNNAVTEAKDKAQAKVDELPESTGKDSFQDRLDVIDGIVVPGITDQDKDGLDDTLQAEVEDLVKAAEEAEKAAEDALVEANKDGLITPEENQNLTDLNNAVTEAKDKAQAKVDELPESTGKDSFQDRLDVIDGIVVPGITDQDKDGLDDTLQAEVEDLVKAAEEAEKAAEDALVEANKDGLITPEENQNLTDLNNAVTEAKDKAQAKVDELPESTGKDSFQDRLDVIDGIVVPGITDQDKDGLDDTLQAEVEDLVKAAEEAEKAAEDALVEANKDGLITPEENQNLTDLNNAVTEAKDKAQAKVDELPESTGKDSFQDRLDVIDGIVVPGITDQDKDGLDDTLQAEVEDLVKAAEEAEKAAEDALVEANKDGLITPEENQNLTDLNNAVTEAKDKAQAKVDELPESTGKDSFQDRLDVIDGIVVPGITDQDKDGLDDTLQAEVEDLVKAAEEAEKAAEDALVEANKDGLITPEENQNLTDLNNAVTEAKDKAQAKVDELPESTGKDSFQDRLDVIDGIVVPGITDQDKDGLDDTLQAEVEDLVKAAEEAEKAAEDALVEANKDGLITPEENQNLTDLNNAVTEAKDKAQAKVDELPESTGKDSFQDRLDVIDGIVVPGITDQDKDGLDDTLQAEVEDLVKAAEEAEKAAEDALVEANKDGLITPEENQNLTDLNNAVTEAKDKAQAKVDELPESTGKDSFQDRLDVIDGIVVPGVTDQDKDGLDDTLQAEVEDLVKAAEEAEKAAEDALVEANKDGLITPEENQNLTDLNNAVTEAKDKAQAKVDELPESTGKDSFQDRLDVIDGIVVPGITDQDKDGLDDTLQAEVEDLVKAAEEAEKAAEDALVEANKDGLITPEENQNLTDLNNAVTEAKDKAQAKVDELPESTGKDSFQDRLDVIDGIVVPGITDQDKDGLDDTLQAEVEDLVKAAEEAEKAAEDALVEANKDGLITPEENQNLTDLNNAVTEAKDKAQAKVDELPESTGKDSFQDRLDVIDGIVVPGITDQDKDGLDDTLQAEVEDLVKAAEEAEKAAEDALVEANKDGLITPEENQNLTDLNNAVTEAKDKAQAKVDELPESTGKDSFQDRLDVIDGIVVPGITDQDKDGLDDTLQAEVEDLVKAAEEAEKAAEDALVEANKDGLITPEENQNLTDLNNAVTEAKDKAQAKVDELPESTGKDSFQDRLDVIDGIVVPGITDQDKDGLDDTLQAEVEDLVKAAEEAEKAAEDALVEANKDGLITPEENQNLTDLNNAVTEAKDKAQAKVDELPESTGKDSFQDRLDVIDGIVVPGITDQDKDGLDDTLQAEVEDLVKAAEEAEKAAEDALVEANKDGLITPEENQNLTDLNNAVTEAKDKAQAKVDELPESTGKDSFQDRLDVIDGIVVPGITDQDKDGLDDTLQAEVEDLVKAAEEAEKAAEDALVEANKDGLITPEENQNLTDLNNAVTEAKDKAQAKVDELPESTGKDSFQDRLDVIDGIVVPGVTDQDKDGLDDTLQAEVEDLVKAAEEAEKAAEDALVEANKDGLITPEENQNLTDLNNAVTEAKDKAQAKVDELPESTGKDSFQDRLDVIDGIVVPGITDQDKDGLDDTLQAEVEDLVKAAEEAEKAAEDALVEANKDGLITPEENQNLTDLNNAVTEAKDKAQAKVDELPESTGKDSFQDRLDVIDGIVVPGITDQDKDGLDDTLQAEVEDLVKAAEEAEKAAEDALVEANKDGLITPEENQNLTDLNNAVTEAKDKAQAKVDELPESTGKDSFQDRLDVIDGIVVPGITDQDKDGLDDTLQAEVEDLVKAAEEAEKAAEDALVEANKDGLITPEENQNLTDLNNAVTEAKDKAQAKVDELPESTGKDSFQDRLDVIDGIVVPGVTDQDKDGLDDTLQAEVEDLVKAAEEAEKAAEDALVEANKDGLITPEENQNLTDLNNAVTEAKDKAQAKVDELPESTGKDSFQDRLDVIDGIVVPGITDQDKDGLDDTLQAEVEDLVKAAEEAEKAAEDALVEANKDGLITPEENQNLTDLNNAVTEAKDKAQAKVDELPESTGKDSFQDRLDVIDGIVVPGITDQDKDGLDDTLQAEVEDLVKAAEEAEKAAEDALVEANKDGLITPEENQNLTDLNNAVTEAKDKAQAKVDELPESTGKDSFQDRLDVIDGIVVPGVTDKTNEMADSPTVDATAGGGITIKPGEDNIKLIVQFIDESDNKQTITLEINDNGNWVSDTVLIGFEVDTLSGEVNLSPELVKDGSVVKATGTDVYSKEATDSANALTDDNTPDAADAPVVDAVAGGSVTATPGADNVEQVIVFTDETGTEQTITATKGADGSWTLDKEIDGVSLDATSGVVTLAPDAVKDGSTVTATGSDAYENTASDSAKALDVADPEIANQTISYDENQVPADGEVTTVVGKVTATDNVGIVSYEIMSGNDLGYFDIDSEGNIILTAAGLAAAANDFETDPNSFDLAIKVEDAAGNSSQATLTLQVNDVDEAVGPVTDSDASDNLVSEVAAIGTEVGITALAVDPDAKDTVRYVLSNSANGLFSIDEQTGVVTVAAELDYATAQSHTITVQAISTDGTASEKEDFTINVAKNNPATVTDAQGAVVEDAAETTISGTVTITDLDEGEAFAQPQTKQGAYGTFSVNENGNWSYALDNGKPEVQALREGQTVEDIFTVTSKDGTGTGTVTVTITGTNDQPKLDVVDIVDIVTEIYQGYVDTSMSIADANGSDIDEGDVLTYSLPDNNQGYFAIDESTGVITLTEAGVDYINAGNDLPSQLTIMVSDNSGANNDSITQIIDLPATILATRVVFVEVTDDSNEEVENLPANQNSAYGVNGVYTGIVANNSDGSVQTDPAVLQGLTNDTTPTITVTLEKPLRTATSGIADEAVQVVLTPTQGEPVILDMGQAQVSADGMTYTWSNFTLAQTQALGNDYRVDAQVVAGTVKPTLSTEFTLDTLAGRPTVSLVQEENAFDGTNDSENNQANIQVIGGTGEVGGTVIFDVNRNGIFDAGDVSTVADANGNWKLAISELAGKFDFANDGDTTTGSAETTNSSANRNQTKDLYANLMFVDKAGNKLPNESFAKFYLFDETTGGAAFLASDEPLGATIYNRYNSNGKNSININQRGEIQTDGTGQNVEAIVFDSDNTDKLIIVDGNMQAIAAPLIDFAVLTGNGNDFFTLSGRQSLRTHVYMGEGDDTYEGFRIRGYGGRPIVDLGSGNDILNIESYVRTAIVNLGEGNDTANVGTYISDTEVRLGNGNNLLTVGNYLEERTTITAGSGNDTINIGQTLNDDSRGGVWVSNINAGDGDNTINIKGRLIASLASEAGYGEIITGSGQDNITISGIVDGRNAKIDTGSGNDVIDVGVIQRQATVITGPDALTPGTTDNDTLIAVALDDNALVRTGAGNDIVKISSNIVNSTLSMGSGIDHLQVNQVRGNSTIDMGEGNDTVNMERLGQTLASTGTPNLRLGAGADNLDLGVLRRGNIYSGNDTDQDIININNMEAGYVELGNTDILNISNLQSGTIKSSQGGNDVSISGSMTGGTIDLGTARDDVSIANKSAGNVFLGDGNDTIDVTTHSGGDIDTGAGNDTVTIDTMSGGNIYLASGNDTISINTFTGGTLNGGDGTDTLHITGGGNTLSSSNISAIEVLDLGVGNNANILNLRNDDARSNGYNNIRIDGDALDTVNLTKNLAGQNWTKGSIVGDYTIYEATYFSQKATIYIDTDIKVVI
ncbi:Protein of avirulence locus involved in temperature-dependent protein secretion [Psychrobacter phenylpyruvicus]|uniref:Protein of avirulence locus involved in temperature-dependent protein secretion n=1 Tax=Psychrobacter phenylpyruvicus TaxID=29432 RepID=A0A379LMR2_9GAMM|nr:Protein of avirulence locus involved in temperature-dependent protein secretion [Psychrobacter phenylpyruvicus]